MLAVATMEYNDVPVLMPLFACHRFSFCQYPFILSLAAKREILQRDSEQQMIVMARVGGFLETLQRKNIPQIRDDYGSGWVGPGLTLNFFWENRPKIALNQC